MERREQNRSHPCILPMTITTYKDQLFSKVNELGVAQQEVDRLRSAIHCIIATLPGEVKDKASGLPPSVCESRQSAQPAQSAARSPHDECYCTKPRPRPVLEKKDCIEGQPLIAAPQPEMVKTKPASKPKSTPAAKRMNSLEKKARIQEALLYRKENPHLTLGQVAVRHGLEPKALSRSYANKLKKAMPPDRDKTPKDEADDFLYGEQRRKEW